MPQSIAPPLEPLLTEKQAAPLLGVSHRTLQAWRVRGGGPEYVKSGASVRYRPKDLEAWLEKRTHANTASKGQGR